MKEKKEIFTAGPAQPKIQKRFGYDNMSMKINFASGAHLRFSVGRSGDKLEMAFSNDPLTSRQQFEMMKKWIDYRGEETNQQRFDRLEKLVAGCASGKEVIANLDKF